ncbi:hypothetical protein NN6n1_12730 [Shinella zoogloeoides]
MTSEVGKLIRATVEPHTTLCLFETITSMLESSDIKGERARRAAAKAVTILRREQQSLLRDFDQASLGLKAAVTNEPSGGDR